MTPASTTSSISELLLSGLKKTITELTLYENEEALWIKKGDINNSAGNLALHIAGAVNHFVGAALGKNGFVRDREKEFSLHGVPVEEIISQLKRAMEVVPQVLGHLKDEDTFREFPEKIGGNVYSINLFLIHLVGHINYHLGQINYHRRLLQS